MADKKKSPMLPIAGLWEFRSGKPGMSGPVLNGIFPGYHLLILKNDGKSDRAPQWQAFIAKNEPQESSGPRPLTENPGYSDDDAPPF